MVAAILGAFPLLLTHDPISVVLCGSAGTGEGAGAQQVWACALLTPAAPHAGRRGLWALDRFL